MYCPNCKNEFVFMQFDQDILIEPSSKSEISVIFTCHYCKEQYTICIAQEDLNPAQS